MTIFTIDTETRGLSAHPKDYITGCVVKEDMTYEFFDKPELMWNFLIETSIKLQKQKKE